jgi:single-strand DNA-binding protein
MDGLNEANLIGNVGKDVELKHLDNDKKVAKIVLATNKTYKKANGEKESKTEWHNIEFWGDTAQFCGNYIKKGMMLYISGELRTDQFEKEGQKHYRTKIVGNEIKILSNGSSEKTNANSAENAGTTTNSAPVNGNTNTQGSPSQQAKQYASETVSSNTFAGSDDNEDLPF